MQPYFKEVSDLRAAIADAKSYAATEPVFDYMAQAVGLVDKTPSGFARSAANDIDPSPGDIRDFDRALSGGSVDVLIYNTQTQGAVPSQLRSAAKAAGVPIVDVTESPPAGLDLCVLAGRSAQGARAGGGRMTADPHFDCHAQVRSA